MAHRLLENFKTRVKRPQRAAAQELAAASLLPIPLPTPSKPVSESVTALPSQATPSPPTSTLHESVPLPSLQDRIWNDVYDALKENEEKLVAAYEKVLSAKLDQHGSSPGLPSTESRIGRTQETRSGQMQRLVHYGLHQTEKQASVKQRIDQGLQAVQAVRGIVDKAVQAAPEAAVAEAAVAWVGVCLGLKVHGNSFICKILLETL